MASGGGEVTSDSVSLHSPKTTANVIGEKMPFRKKFIAVLRQKFATSRSNSIKEDEDSCNHEVVIDAAVLSNTICNSWRATRPRRVEQPIRPAYSDECLSCCTGSRCRRGTRSIHREGRADLSAAVVKPVVVKKPCGGALICRICHAKNDRSPSEIDALSERDATSSQRADEEKIRMERILPAEAAYGAAAYGHASAPFVESSSVSEISPSSSCDDTLGTPSRLHADRTSPCLHVCELHELTCEPLTVPPLQPFYDQVKEHGATAGAGKGWSLSKELFRLSNYGWYWGPITRVEAEEKLAGQTDGAFLVRDSSDERYLLSLSFRSFGRTLHTRIEHCNGVFSFYAQPESEGYGSIVDLIEHSITDSQSGVFCYSRARVPGSPSFPVRLAKPVSRFAQVRTLQYLCRFVIRQSTRVDHIQWLPLPLSIRGWVEEGQY